MNWRNTLTICFVPLMVLTYIFTMSEENTDHTKPQRKIASAPHVQKVQDKKVISPRSIAAINGKKIRHMMLKNRIPQSIESTFEKDPEIKLTRGYEFLKDVAAVPVEHFNASMGEVIQRNEQFVFFRVNPGHGYVPVAISKSTNMLYPISSILHIKNVTPEMRAEILSQGYKQYYYHPPMKFLSIQSQAGQVVSLYQELLKKGHKVELEVLKPHHQTK